MIKPEDVGKFQEKYIQGADRIITPMEEFRRYQYIVKYNLKNKIVLSSDNLRLLPKSIRDVMDKENISDETRVNMYYDLIDLEQLAIINCLDKAIIKNRNGAQK